MRMHEMSDVLGCLYLFVFVIESVAIGPVVVAVVTMVIVVVIAIVIIVVL